jgi:hypothetical protein
MSRKNSSPSSPREMDVVACIQPISVLERLWDCRIFRTDQTSARFLLDGFMTRCRLTPSVPEATQADALALVSQPWSYLRLEAYSFFGLCEGA